MTIEELQLISEARELVQSGKATEIREAAHLSQSEVAAFCDVTPACVCRWENGQRLPRGAPAKRLARLMRSLAERTANVP